ncbi:hypothetical protein K435DRAFT_959858 [Dendrothele bispora CBS 962.96]|uniref:GH16 domain-containing protein n=1 Tax=Dendrothele bispora (strain CBS 962.96) TaxID=1314807 RepID=A0A4S8MVE5_DENBC|nr:hypothetical protein K435DRAFT_959858 [Dendrothele bispora CBS 962.96]
MYISRLATSFAGACLFLAQIPSLTKGYDLVRDYSGITFFDEWDFYGSWDNLTLGDVVWLSESDAFSQGLAYVNSAGNAILKVDNTHNVQDLQKRSSVRITTKDSYAVGSLWIIDLRHIPFGCSVWPAFWTKGPVWPDDGEIDIMEAINLMPNNQMALHTTSGCMHTTPPNQMGQTLENDCSTPSGCTVGELQPNSFGSGFAAMGGGVWATQFDVQGIFIWFWSRPNIPPSILGSTSISPIDISDFGPPSASYLATSCDITEFFTPQNLVLDITLCGIWAGLPETWLPSCGGQGPTNICYTDNVVGPGSNYNDAFFEVSYVRAYTTGGIVPVPTATPVAAADNSHRTFTSVVTTTPSPDGILHPSPLFFPGNGASHGHSMIGCWWVTSILVVISLRLWS